jgi:hypothetical protein
VSLLAALAAGAALVFAAAPWLAPPAARADDGADVEETFSVTVEKATMSIKIKHPKGEEAWAKTVRAALEKGLPPLSRTAGFKPSREDLVVKFAPGTAETGGYEAFMAPDELFVRKKCSRGGYHAHWVLAAAASLWTEQVAKPEWLKRGLAHLYVQRALKSAPAIYEARAYRDEILEERLKVQDEAPLDQWTPAPPGAGVAPEEQPVPLPHVAKAFAYLYLVDGRLEGKLLAAAKSVATGEDDTPRGPLATREFVGAVSKAAGKDVAEYFVGWAYAAPPEGGPPPKTDPTDLMDSDMDGLLNFEEEVHGTDKAKADTDGDKVPDGEEVEDGTNPKEKDAKRTKVRIDGDGKEWMKLKKFSMQDMKGDAKKDGDKVVTGGDLLFCKVACDEKYLYVMLEVDDAFTNPDCVYTLAIDAGDDGVPMDSKNPEEQRKVVWNYMIGFRPENPRPWIGVTHNQKDQSWMEWRNHWRLGLALKEKVAELRIPIKALELPDKVLIMAYVRAKDGKLSVDSVQRELFDMAKFRD